MKKTIIFLALCFSGCLSTNITVQTTKSYEGHFYSADEVKKATENIQLNSNESVWILSNTTLKRILKNTERK